MNKNEKKMPVDTLPPHDDEAELGILGSVMLDPVAAMGECEERGVVPGWFYDLRHAAIFRAYQGLYADTKPIDPIMVHGWLQAKGWLEEVGGLDVLQRLPDYTTSAANVGAYIETVRDKWLLRRMVSACTEAVGRIMESDDDVPTLMDEVERDILKISEQRLEDREREAKDVLIPVIDELENYHRGGAQIRGVTTGLEYVDKLLCGLGGKNGNYIVISARPSMGKTAFAMEVAAHAAMDYECFEPVLDASGKVVIETVDGADRVKVKKTRGVPVGVFSLEMTAEALVHRMLFQRAKADMQRWRTGFAVTGDIAPLTVAASEIRKSKMLIDDEGRCTIEALKAKARRWHRQYGIKLFVIDYIQLMRSSAKRFRDDRVQELAEISGEIQKLGKELNVPFIVLAQMNRDYEKDVNRAPRLSDLKDCGSIEQDADLVGFLYGPKMKDGAAQKYDDAMVKEFGNDWSKYPTRVNLMFAKNRHGPTGVCELLFQKSCTHFGDYREWMKQKGYMSAAEGDKLPNQKSKTEFEPPEDL